MRWPGIRYGSYSNDCEGTRDALPTAYGLSLILPRSPLSFGSPFVPPRPEEVPVESTRQRYAAGCGAGSLTCNGWRVGHPRRGAARGLDTIDFAAFRSLPSIGLASEPHHLLHTSGRLSPTPAAWSRAQKCFSSRRAGATSSMSSCLILSVTHPAAHLPVPPQQKTWLSDENSFFGLKVPEGTDRRELYKSQYRAIYTYKMSAAELDQAFREAVTGDGPDGGWSIKNDERVKYVGKLEVQKVSVQRGCCPLARNRTLRVPSPCPFVVRSVSPWQKVDLHLRPSPSLMSTTTASLSNSRPSPPIGRSAVVVAISGRGEHSQGDHGGLP